METLKKELNELLSELRDIRKRGCNSQEQKIYDDACECENKLFYILKKHNLNKQ